MDDTDPAFDATARTLFQTAISENRCGELLACLFDGGSATVDSHGRLVLADAGIINQLINGDRS